MADTPTLPRPRRSRSNTPLGASGIPISIGTPKRNGLLHFRQRVEEDVGDGTPDAINGSIRLADASFRNDDKVSPMLAKLRMTPGRLLKEKQTILVRKHEESRRKVDSLNVGGGVSLWPEMVSMRLTREDVRNLVGSCLLLCSLVTGVFYLLHGVSIFELLEYRRKLSKFSKNHPIVITQGQEKLDQSVIHWHTSYREIVDSVHQAFDVTRVPTTYMVYILVYVATAVVLFYYLIDNMFAKSKLSPKRIKRWVRLLSLTGTWTFLIIATLVIALQTETAIEINIHMLSDILADVIPTSLSCDKLNSVLQYWRTRCLPPTTHGTISIFGVLPVRDVTFYLQYYAIPIVTVLIMPVFNLIVSVMTVHNVASPKS